MSILWSFLRGIALAYGVRLVAPFIFATKAQVMDSLPPELLALTWSCYEPTAAGKPCGTCNSCKARG